MGGVKGFVEGGIASVVAGSTTYPLNLIGARMQLHQSVAATNPPARPAPRMGLIKVGVNIVRHNGVAALFSGVSMTVICQTLHSATSLGLYDIMKTKWTDPATNVMPLTHKIRASMAAGAIGAALRNPADLAMMRICLPIGDQCHDYKTVIKAVVLTVKYEGLMSLWRGSSMKMTRAMLVTSSQLATYDQMKETVLRKKVLKDGIGMHAAFGFTAGFMASVAANPLDVITRRMMNMKLEARKEPPYAGAMDCAVKTVRAEGPMALYKGFIPTISRLGPYTMVMFVTLEQVRKLVKDF